MISQYLASLACENENDNETCTCNTTGLSPVASGLNCALLFLQQKVETKDEMISELTEELRQRTNPSTFEVLMDTLDDFKDDCSNIPNCVRQVMRTPAEKPCAPKEGCQCVKPQAAGEFDGGNVDPSPLAITVMRKISPDSILLKWEKPTSSHIKGYEVEINGDVKSKIHSATRTAAVLNGLQTDAKMCISVFAVSVTGMRCHPAATAVYQPRPSSSDEKVNDRCTADPTIRSSC